MPSAARPETRICFRRAGACAKRSVSIKSPVIGLILERGAAIRRNTKSLLPLWCFCSRVLICVSLGSAPVMAADRVSREAVEALEAYAVYKMAQYPEAYRRFLGLAQKDNVQGMLNVANMLQAGLGTERDAAGRRLGSGQGP